MAWNGEAGWAAGPGPPLLTGGKEDVVGPCLAPPAPSVSAWVLLCLLLKASAHPQRQERLQQPPFTTYFLLKTALRGSRAKARMGRFLTSSRHGQSRASSTPSKPEPPSPAPFLHLLPPESFNDVSVHWVPLGTTTTPTLDAQVAFLVFRPCVVWQLTAIAAEPLLLTAVSPQPSDVSFSCSPRTGDCLLCACT